MLVPSSGGAVKFPGKSYRPGTITVTFSLLIYISMVIAENLVFRTFRTDTLRLFNIESNGIRVPILGVSLITVAFLVNIAGK